MALWSPKRVGRSTTRRYFLASTSTNHVFSSSQSSGAGTVSRMRTGRLPASSSALVCARRFRTGAGNPGGSKMRHGDFNPTGSSRPVGCRAVGWCRVPRRGHQRAEILLRDRLSEGHPECALGHRIARWSRGGGADSQGGSEQQHAQRSGHGSRRAYRQQTKRPSLRRRAHSRE